MVFSSAIFLFIFLPIVFILDRLLPSIKAKNSMLLVVSLLFYSFGKPEYLILLLCSTALNHVCGRIAASQHRRAGVIIAVTGNLSLLCVFKYADFAIGTVNPLFGTGIPLINIALPVGISFFTFQGLSYVIDVYRDHTLVSKSFAKTLLYISFFPQLIAGPIVKYHDIEQEIDQRQVNPRETAYGICRFICGLAKKLLISNAVGQIADTVFALELYDIGAFSAWLGAICYTLQIYFDFSGYSDMAIGMGHMFGFHFLENFEYPYTATTIKEFWRRWHISLSSWFRDYLYIPLGGNQKGKLRTYLNKFFVFFATGLWHGASWNFVLWGLWHGLFSILEDIPIFPRKYLQGKWLGRLYTMLIVVLGFVLFRAESLAQAGGVIRAMFTGFGALTSGDIALLGDVTVLFLLTAVIACVLCAPVAKRIDCKHDTIRLGGALALLVLCMLNLATGSFNPFIYFRF